MCGRAYSPDFLFMWPSAKISVMGPEQAAGVLTQVSVDLRARPKHVLMTDRAKNGHTFCRWKRQSENVMVVHGQPQTRQLSQTSCGKSTLLKPQQHIPAPGYGACEVFGRMSHLRNNAGSFCTARRYASTGYQVCRDDGIIDPADTRRVLGLALAAATQHRPTPTHYGVFRF